MQDLRLIGVHEDGQHLLLADADGGRFRLSLDEPLRAAARRDRPGWAAADRIDGGLRPRDIQTLTPSGAVRRRGGRAAPAGRSRTSAGTRGPSSPSASTIARGPAPAPSAPAARRRSDPRRPRGSNGCATGAWSAARSNGTRPATRRASGSVDDLHGRGRRRRSRRGTSSRSAATSSPTNDEARWDFGSGVLTPGRWGPSGYRRAGPRRRSPVRRVRARLRRGRRRGRRASHPRRRVEVPRPSTSWPPCASTAPVAGGPAPLIPDARSGEDRPAPRRPTDRGSPSTPWRRGRRRPRTPANRRGRTSTRRRTLAHPRRRMPETTAPWRPGRLLPARRREPLRGPRAPAPPTTSRPRRLSRRVAAGPASVPSWDDIVFGAKGSGPA